MMKGKRTLLIPHIVLRKILVTLAGQGAQLHTGQTIVRSQPLHRCDPRPLRYISNRTVASGLHTTHDGLSFAQIVATDRKLHRRVVVATTRGVTR